MNNFKAWLGWSIAAIFVFYQFLLQVSTSVMIPELMHSFSIDVASVSTLSACFFYSYIIFQIPAGCLVDRYGARSILLSSIVGCALACALFAATNNILIAGAARILMGFFVASSVVGAMYLATRLFPIGRFAFFAGLTEMLGMLGGAIGQNVLAFLVVHMGWRNSMLLCSITGIILAILAYGFVFDGQMNTESQEVKHKVLTELKQVLKVKHAWLNGIYGGLVFAVINGFAALWAVPYLMTVYPISLTKAAAASSMIFWGAAAGGFVIGSICACYPYKKLIMKISTFLLLLLLVIVIYGAKIPLSLMFTGLFFIGFFTGVYVLMFAVICDIVPCHLRGAALGFTNMMGILFGAPILQQIIGFLLKLQTAHYVAGLAEFSVYEYRIAFLPLVIGVFLALLSLFFIKKNATNNC